MLMKWFLMKESNQMIPLTTSAIFAKRDSTQCMTSKMKAGTLSTLNKSDIALVTSHESSMCMLPALKRWTLSFPKI